MTAPRGLTASEAALWKRVAATVVPLVPPSAADGPREPATAEAPPPPAPRPKKLPARIARPVAVSPPPPQAGLDSRTLDATWDRRLARGLVAPDAEIDLHGLGLHQAHDRLMASLTQARAIGARVLLVIAGKPRPHDDHGFSDHGARGNRRGAIRAKLLDWLAASPHAGAIAAIRPAHQRHGGSGAVYVVLRRARP